MDPRGLIRLQALFLFSLLLVLIRKVDSKDHLWNWGRKTNAAVLLCLIIPIWGAAQVLNMPLLTMYRFGIYEMAFLLGYFVFSHDNVQQIVQNMHIPMLLIAIFLGILYAVTYYGQNYAASTCLQSLLTNAYL